MIGDIKGEIAKQLLKLYWGTRRDKMPSFELCEEREELLEDADSILSIVIQKGGVCIVCGGKKRFYKGVYKGMVDCSTCKGLGRLPDITVRDAIKADYITIF